ncbi:hypothetical protein FRC08_011796 [Ceratobasidium sp. 394]|nr:hypothetical protein FRC08_011796 [Ceratobasidium sp. 394]KAG9102067.1 hypothetical protein FS749_016255 [Ceratobasidium sp. UAMH 11750]
MHRLWALWSCLAYSGKVFAQISKGSFVLVTTDPVCVQCDYATVAWNGGIAPYVLSVSGYKNSYKLANVGTTSTNQMKWHVNFPAGTRLWFQLVDSNSTDIYTNIVTVAASSDASCVNVTNPLVTDSSTSLSASPSTASTAISSTAAAPGASGSPDPNGRRSSAGPIAGGIVAGVMALLLLLLLAFWWRRKSKRQSLRPGSKTELDMRAEPDGMIVEPFLPDAQILQSNMRAAEEPVPRKIRIIPSTSFSSTPLISSDAGPSTTASSSSAPQSPYEAPLSVPSPTSASRKHTRPVAAPAGPVQESDAGVRLMGGVTREQPTTLPPAYDSSWRE